MPIQVDVPGHGIVEFPDGMSDDQISNAIRQNIVQEPSMLQSIGAGAANLGKGAIGGAADIGNTIINASTFIPRKLVPELDKWNEERQSSLKSFSDDNKDSLAFQAGRIAANLAGTAGVGGVLEKITKGLSQSPRALQIAEALRTGGMSARGAGMGTRIGSGAVTGGASAGLVDPELAGTGAAVGAALPPAIKGAFGIGSSAMGGAKALAEPFYQGGREMIIGRALRNAAGNQADDAMQNLSSAQPLVPGSMPTAAMAAGNPGIAALERAAVANNPVATNELSLRLAANNDARQAALQGIIPDRQAAQSARTGATEALYSQSSKAPVEMTEELVTLLQRPSMQSAVSRAAKLADEAGEEFDLNNMTGRSAQYIKMALDDMANSAPMTGIGGNELRSIQATRQAYLDQLGEQIPEYLQANKAYADLSRPLDQVDVLEELANKSTNFRGDLTPAAYARTLSDRTAQRVTGRPNATLERTLTPDQLQVLQNIRGDLLNQDFAQTAGRGVGSNTVQNLAYTNMMDQTGIPNSLSGSPILGALGNIAGRAGDVAYKRANERLAAELAEALLDPTRAGKAMQITAPSSRNQALVNALSLGAGRSVPVIYTNQR